MENPETISQEKGVWKRRKIHESIFNKATPWDPLKAYLLGQFKAGCNLQKKLDGFQISSTNLQHLIKLQVWLRSNHKIFFNEKQKAKYVNGSVIYTLHVRNKLIISDLRRLGFVASQDKSAKNNARIPEDMPSALLPHFLRGFLDERGHAMAESRGGKNYKVYSADKAFLETISALFCDKYSIPSRTVYKHKAHESYYIKYSGSVQLQRIFNFLYLDFPISSGTCDVSVYAKFCKTLGFECNYENIDLEFDMKSLYLLHGICCERGVDPNLAIKFNLSNFLNYCKSRNLISDDKEKIISDGKEVSARFCGTSRKIDWNEALKNITELLGSK